MLESLRKKQKIVIYIIAFVFIVGMAVMGVTDIFFKRNDFVGKVNGVKITYDMFQKELQQNVENYRNQNKSTEITSDVMSMLTDQTWQRLTQRIIFNQQVRKNGIKVTDEDVLKEMETNPPQELMQNPALQINGRFDRKKYLTALKQDAQFFSLLDNYYRESLPFKKLMEKIKKKANINLDSLKADYVKSNDEVVGKLIWFDYNKVPKPAVSDAEIKAYYDKNKETDKEINKGKAVAMKFLTFELKPSDNDYKIAKRDIDDIYSMLMRGEDFATLAKESSDDPGSAAKGGSLGVFGQGQMVPEFEKTAFAMQPGQISKPVKTQFGWHIIRVDSIGSKDGQPQVKASHILKKVATSAETKDAMTKQAEAARKLIKKLGMEKAAAQLKMQPQDTDLMYKGSDYIPIIGKHDNLLRFVWKKGVGAVSKVEKDRKGNLIVAQVTVKQKTPYVEFEKAKMRIKFDLEKQKKIAYLKPIAEKFVKANKPAEYFIAAAKDSLIKIIDIKNFKKDTFIQDVGRDQEVNDAALKMSSGQTSGLITTKDGFFIIYCETRTRPDIAAFMKDDGLQKQIRDRLEEQAWNRWYDAMMKKAKIIDNRQAFNF